MTSLNESRAVTLSTERRRDLLAHNSHQLTRVYPAGLRIRSDNMGPYELSAVWRAGCQMIAMNFQTWDEAMQVNQALFALNGGCDSFYEYLLKTYLLDGDSVTRESTGRSVILRKEENSVENV